MRAGCRRHFKKGIDIDAIDSAADIPYDIPNVRVEYVRAEPPAVPTGFWRGVGPNNNVFAIESFMDELARKANKDPVAFRRDLLDKTPRLKTVLDLAAQKAGWGSPLPARTGRGVAVQVAFGSFIATVAQAEVDEHGEVRVQRIVSAVDTGIVVNPDTVIAQLQGGLVFGLTAALYGHIEIDKGRVRQSNFHDYRMLRINEMPQIEVHLIKAVRLPAASARPEPPPRPPRSGMPCSPRPVSGCADYRSTVMCCPGGSRHERQRAKRSPKALRPVGPRGRYCRGGDRPRMAPVSRRGRPISPVGKRVALADYRGPDPTGVPPELKAASIVQRGEYLTRAADCEACHTAGDGAPFAGGRPFVLPFGTLYSTNITPDQETGIGSYSDADFLNALHKGIGRGNTATVSGDAVRKLYVHDRCRCAGDQGVSVQSQTRACGGAAIHA